MLQDLLKYIKRRLHVHEWVDVKETQVFITKTEDEIIPEDRFPTYTTMTQRCSVCGDYRIQRAAGY